MRPAPTQLGHAPANAEEVAYGSLSAQALVFPSVKISFCSSLHVTVSSGYSGILAVLYGPDGDSPTSHALRPALPAPSVPQGSTSPATQSSR